MYQQLLVVSSIISGCSGMLHAEHNVPVLAVIIAVKALVLVLLPLVAVVWLNTISACLRHSLFEGAHTQSLLQSVFGHLVGLYLYEVTANTHMSGLC